MFRTAFGQIRPNIRTFNDDAAAGGSGGGGDAGDQGAQGGDAGDQGGDSGQAGDQSAAQKVEDLPDWAQKIIRDTRAEAANHRTAKTSAEQQLTALKDAASVALGLKQGETPDPAKLTEQLTAAQQAQRDSAIQLAVYRAAGQHKGNPDALLDSNTFLASVKALDPSGADFSTQVSEAVKTAVGANPSLRLVQATGSSAADHAGGSGEQGRITEQQLASMTPEQIDKALREGRLNHLL